MERDKSKRHFSDKKELWRRRGAYVLGTDNRNLPILMTCFWELIVLLVRKPDHFLADTMRCFLEYYRQCAYDGVAR